MALKVEKMKREFSFNGVRLPDPNPELSAEQVRDFYTPQYPEISTAAIEGPEAKNGKLAYSFSRAVGSKG